MATGTIVSHPDTQDMVIVHRAFRREFALLPEMIRQVAPVDVTRAERVGSHCSELLDVLHHHHSGEDELLWPVLHARAEVDDGLITTMEQQHRRIAELVARVQEALPPWRKTADASQRDRIAASVEELSAAVGQHLDQEEREILPLAERHLSVAEWEAIGERSMASLPKNRLLVIFGYVLEDTTPDERRFMLGKAPWVARVMFPLVGHRQWQREITELRAGLPARQ